MHKILVSWSGGLDSTYLIQYLLEKGNKVDATYVDINRGTLQSKREEIARKKLNELFSKNTNFFYQHNYISLSLFGTAQNLYLQQILPFLYNAICSPKIFEYDYVAIGYILNDDAISFLEEINGIWNKLSEFSINKLPPLWFPLTRMSKEDIWNKIDHEYKNLVTWCENEKIDNCGECKSCKRMHGLFEQNNQLPLF